MSTLVLDASGLLALLRDEPGGERIAKLLADSSVCTVNLSEVVAHFARAGRREEEIRSILNPLEFERVPFDEELAYLAGALVALTRPAGLSFGDRACLALALRLGVRAVTADRAWRRIAGAVGVEIELIR